VREHVAVAPPRTRAVGVPRRRRGELDRATEPLAFGVRDPDELRAFQGFLRAGRASDGGESYRTLVRVLVAPDKFKGTLEAPDAAEAIARGWLRARPDDVLDLVPLADGGEGTLDSLVEALGGTVREARVEGPLGDPVTAPYALVPHDGRTIAIVETAYASGLALVSENRRDPMRASTFGAGQLIAAACAAGVDEVLVGLGGSATVDGGLGAAQAVGVAVLDRAGRPVGRGGRRLADIDRIDVTGLDRAVRRARIVAACDVDNVLTGPAGAAASYGPQKGASPDDVLELDRGLGHLAAVLHRDLGIDFRRLPGGGAAGGLGAGLAAFLGAHLRPGARVVMEAIGFPRRLAASEVVVTGEGRVDAGSARGKVVGAVTDAARASGRRVLVLCGEAGDVPAGIDVHSLAARFGRERALDRTADALEDLAAEVAAGIRPLSSAP
jgi:glycerate kinase